MLPTFVEFTGEAEPNHKPLATLNQTSKITGYCQFLQVVMSLLLETGRTLNHCIFPRKYYYFKVLFYSDLKSKSAFSFTKHTDLFGSRLLFKFQGNISNINELSVVSVCLFVFSHYTSLHSLLFFLSQTLKIEITERN